MDRKKLIYIACILILAVIVSVTVFSYAIWSARVEDRGKLNIIVGELNYTFESNDLNNNNQITLAAKETKIIEVKIISQNRIDSIYKLYTNNNNIKAGSTEVNTLEAMNGKIVKILLYNTSDSSQTATLGIKGGLVGKELTLSSGQYEIGTGGIIGIDNLLASYTSSQIEGKEAIICSLAGETPAVYYDCALKNTVEQAFADRTKGAVILLKNSVIETRIDKGSSTDFVVELNGKNLDTAYLSEGYSSAIANHGVIRTSGKLVINDRVGGGGMHTGGASQVMYANTGANIIINGGDYKGRSSIYTLDSTNVVINGGSFDSNSDKANIWLAGNGNITINGGTFTISETYHIVETKGDGTFTINGGTFTSNKSSSMLYVGASTLNITGGSFSIQNSYIINTNSSSNVRINISGGDLYSAGNTAILLANGITNITGGSIRNGGNHTINIGSNATLNINATNPVYISAASTTTGVAAIVAQGTLNVTASPADACTATPSDTTSGLCAYGRMRSLLVSNFGTANVNGGTFIAYNSNNGAAIANQGSTIDLKNAVVSSPYGYGIYNTTYTDANEVTSDPGTTRVCSSTITGNKDLGNTGAAENLVISTNNTFSNGTNTPASNKVVGVYSSWTSSTCPF